MVVFSTTNIRCSAITEDALLRSGYGCACCCGCGCGTGTPPSGSSRACSAALLAARHVRRRPRAVRKCGPLSTRTHQAFLHHVMCLFDTSFLHALNSFPSLPQRIPLALSSLLLFRALPGPQLLFLFLFLPSLSLSCLSFSLLLSLPISLLLLLSPRLSLSRSS